jgi:transcriptional regulator with XRE-family HTH domain
MADRTDHRLTREEASDALGIAPDLLQRLERSGALKADQEGTYEALALAAAVVRYGLQRLAAADQKLAQVGAALADVKPALERLSVLPDKTELTGESYERVMIEVAAFFTAFADVMNRATAALHADDEDGSAA